MTTTLAGRLRRPVLTMVVPTVTLALGACGQSPAPSVSITPVAAPSAREAESTTHQTKSHQPSAPPTPAPATPGVWDEAFLEETARPVFLQLERTSVFMYEAYTMVRFTPWRRTTAQGRNSAVRMGFGSGLGLESTLQSAMNAEAEAGGYADMMRWMGLGADQYFEASYFQLDAVAIDRVIAFVQAVVDIDMKRPASCVDSRFVEAHWGDLYLRRSGNDLLVFIGGDVNAWTPLHARRFIAGLREAQRSLRELEAAAPCVDW